MEINRSGATLRAIRNARPSRLNPHPDHVLSGNEREQRIRISGLALQGARVDSGQQGARVGDQRRDQPVLRVLVIPNDVRLAGACVVIPVRVGAHQLLPAGDLTAEAADAGDQLGDRVVWLCLSVSSLSGTH